MKHDLYIRDFASAFDTQEKRVAYALRWSVTRAAGYAAVFRNYESVLLEALNADADDGDGEDQSGENGQDGQGKDGPPAEHKLREDDVSYSPAALTNNISSERATSKANIVSIGGGGGAELIGLALGLSSSSSSSSNKPTCVPNLNLNLLDIADWEAITDTLFSSLHSRTHTLPPSPTTTTTTVPNINATFQHSDILALSPSALQATFAGVKVVTIFFTLNELYATSMGGTTSFLLALGDLLDKGAVVWVVDSPGSYAGVVIGRSEKGVNSVEKEAPKAEREVPTVEEDPSTHKKHQPRRYPMKWLLDHTLLELARQGKDERKWEKLVDEESRWFRWEKDEEKAEGLRYHDEVELEDMRMQVHVYRRI